MGSPGAIVDTNGRLYVDAVISGLPTVAVSGNIIIGSVSANVDSIYVQSGTMYVSSGNFIGSVFQSTNPWITSGTSTVAGSIYATGSINVANYNGSTVVSNFPSLYTIQQNATQDNNNSSSGILIAGGSFVGSATSTLGVNAIQVSLKTDRNCKIFVEQSPDGSNWDLSDSYNYYKSLGNFGLTVQAINSYVRVRVNNQDTTGSTSYFRLQTVLCPIVEALPRSLDENGNLKVGIKGIEDSYGFGAENTPTGEIRSVTPYRLVGATFNGTTIDPNFWTSTTISGASNNQSNAQIVLSAGSLANSKATIQSIRTARYLGASSNRFRSVIRIPDTAVSNNQKRWGAFNGSDGAFFQLSGVSFGVGLLKGGSETVINTGSFNGILGDTYSIGSQVKTYEIYWTNSKVWYVIGDDTIHTYSASDTTWSTTMNLPIRIENHNINNGSTASDINVRVATISRLGPLQSAPTYYHNAGSGNYILKYGPGVLQQLNFNSAGAGGATLNIYDNVSASGALIAVFDASKISSPSSMNYGQGATFNNGLTLGQIGSFDITVIYE
jgi:hypothetical protein